MTGALRELGAPVLPTTGQAPTASYLRGEALRFPVEGFGPLERAGRRSLLWSTPSAAWLRSVGDSETHA